MKNITKYYLENSIGTYAVITTSKYEVFYGIIIGYINDCIILDNDITIKRSDMKSIDSVTVH